MFRALRCRNFRWFILSQGCSVTGSWIQQVALGWLVYRLTGSALSLGLAGGAAMLPSFFTAPIAGVLADRFDRRRIVMSTQLGAGMQATVLALLVWNDAITLTGVLVLSLVTGFLQGFEWTTRQSLVVHLVEERAILGNAIALNSTVFNLARVAGPLLAGTVLARGGGGCFLLSAAASVLALVFVAQVRTPPTRVTGAKIRLLPDLREGAVYAWREPVIRRGLALVALASGCIMPYSALLPVFAAQVFNGDAGLFAVLAAAPAVGAVGGGLLLASRRNQTGLPGRILVAGVVASVTLVLFACSSRLPVSLVALAVLGGAMMSWTSSLNTQLQTVVAEKMRGRVMSFFSMALMGALPLGYLVLGALTDRIGVTHAVAMGGVCGLAGNIWLQRATFVRSRVWFRSQPA